MFKELINFVVTPRFLRFVPRFVAYYFHSIIRYWWISLLSVGLAILMFATKSPTISIISLLIFFGFFTFFIAFYQDKKVIVFDNAFIKIGIHAPFVIKENEYLDSTEQNKLWFNSIKRVFLNLVRTQYPFTSGFIFCAYLDRPRFTYLLHDSIGIRRQIIKSCRKANLLSCLILCFDETNKKLIFNIYLPPDMANSGFEKFTATFNALQLASENDTELFAESAATIYFALNGYDFIHMQPRNIVFTVIENNEKIFLDTIAKLRNKLTPDSQTIIADFELHFSCEFERIRAQQFITLNQYQAAARHLINIIRRNPNFPFSNFKDYKDEINRRYAVEMADIMKNQNDLLKEGGAVESMFNIEDLEIAKINNLQRLKFPSLPFLFETLKFIISTSPTSDVHQYIETELTKGLGENPASWFIKGELLKFLPKGTERYESVFVARTEEAIAEFEKVRAADPDFALVLLKLHFLKSLVWHYEADEEKRNAAMNECVALMIEGHHLFSQLGLHYMDSTKVEPKN